jgi:hypothetical protein
MSSAWAGGEPRRPRSLASAAVSTPVFGELAFDIEAQIKKNKEGKKEVIVVLE